MIMKRIFSFTLILAWMFALGLSAQTAKLSVPTDLKYGPGKTLAIPVKMDNSVDVTAVEFDITLPFAMVEESESLSSTRCGNHEYILRTDNSSSRIYKVMIYSSENALIAGSSGELMTISVVLPEDAANGQTYNVKLSNVIVSDRTGTNVSTGSENGKITIESLPCPDLQPASVAVAQTESEPGGTLDFTWEVQNIGDTATQDGWTEKIYLEDEDGVVTYIGTTSYSGTLEAGASVERSHSLTLSDYPGVSGHLRPRITVYPAADCGELSVDQNNNTAFPNTYSLYVKKYLHMTLYSRAIRENSGSRYACEVRRTGNLSEAQAFDISQVDALGNTGRLLISDGGKVTFNKGSNKAYFYITPVDNDEVNVNEQITITLNANKNNGYGTLEGTVTIEEDDKLTMSLSLDKEEYNEGETILLTVNTGKRVYPGELAVYFNIEQPTRFKLPARVVLPEGETTATVEIPVLQDKIPANDISVQITATAEHYLKAEAPLFILKDDDVPAIDLTVTPTTVNEGAGASAMYCTLTRSEVTDNKITVKLSDDGNSDLYYTIKTISMPAGTTTVNFPLGVQDNAQKEGDRTVNLTAAVYITACNCDVAGEKQASVVVPITITDDDGPMLSVSSSKSTILEGDEQGCVLTIKCNTQLTEDLVVNLASDIEGLEYEKTVTIPAGQKSVTTQVKAPANDTEEGDRTASLTVSTDAQLDGASYSMGSCWVLISDRTLPDMAFESVQLSKTECGASENLQMIVRLMNVGAADMKAGLPIVVKSNGSVVTQYTTQETVGKGETKEFVIPVQASKVPGEYRMSVVVNEKNNISELQYLNNTSEVINLTVNSLFQFSIQTDRETYNAQETVVLSGTLKAYGGTQVAGVTVEPYILFNGQRTALSAVTVAEGNFSCEYVLPQGYRGEFLYGVCNPGEMREDATQEFNVYGFERTSTSYLTHKLYLNEPYTSTITLKNLTSLPLTGLKAEVTGATDRYDLVLELPEGIEGSQTDAALTYTLTPLQKSVGSAWETINVHLTTNEGATLDLILYCYTNVHTANLVANVRNINTTVTKGVARTYPILLTNTGLAETGKITVSLPSGFGSFLSLATPSEMPSLKSNESTTVMLRFNPGPDMDVNLVQKGNLAINCESGNGIPVYFNVKVVSEDKGGLLVKVRDENTIYGNKDGEHPYVADATVELRDYNTGALIKKMTTGEEGSVLMEDINEGYYQLYVTAPKHDSYRQNVVISPGETTEHMATISYQAVSVSWDVVETEVEDEYEIVTTLTYETQVPVPVVRMTLPDRLNLDLVEYGRSTLFNVILRNDGLITAQNVEVSLFEVDGYTVTPMMPIQGFNLAPECSMTIPVRVTRNEVSAEGRKLMSQRSSTACSGNVGAKFEWPCGNTAKFSMIADVINFFSDNSSCSDPVTGGASGIKPSVTIGASGGPGWTDPNTDIYAGTGGSQVNAELMEDLLCTIIECAPIPDIPIPKFMGGECARAVANIVKSGAFSLGGAASCLGEALEAAKKIAPVVSCLETIYNRFIKSRTNPAMTMYASSEEDKPAMPAYMSAWCTKAEVYVDYWNASKSVLQEKFDAPEMLDAIDMNMLNAIDQVDAALYELYEKDELYDVDLNTIPDDYAAYENALSAGEAGAWQPAEGKKSAAHLTALMPGGVANWYDFRLKNYVERMINAYRIVDGLEPVGENYSRQEKQEELSQKFDIIQTEIVNLGYVTMDEMLAGANEDRINHYESESENTCAKVKLEIEQKMVMTRQAFRGTLTVENSMSTDLKDIDLTVIVTNMDGEQATSHEMQINFESIEGFEGDVNGPWTLAPKTKGVATILFIPTKYAAPDAVTTYSFGGNLYFREADNEEILVRDLYPVKLQVKPSPELDLTYFMQRDIYGDNPLTKDVIEPIVPAEFSVMIRNKGNGDATKVRMFTKQPKIVENEKGLLVDFAIVSSSLNGGEQTLALDETIATDFGDIEAGKSAYATWNMTSSLLGHFVDYEVSASHLTSYGNPDLSLLDEVTIHELIHSVDVTVDGSVKHAWLTNDDADGEDMPDHLYFLDGTVHEVADASANATIASQGNSVYKLSVTAPQKGWYYARVADPTQSIAKILNVEMGGSSVDTDCMWQTQYTILDNNDPLRDNRLHVVFYADGAKTVDFDIEFEPSPEVRLSVVSVETVPNEEDIAESVIEKLTVNFNKPINAETFTREDIIVRREGEIVSTDMAITHVEDSVYDLNTSVLSENGYYTLQVRAEEIEDNEGYKGYEGKMVKWMLFKDGLVHYNVAPWPSAEAGEVVSKVSEDENTEADEVVPEVSEEENTGTSAKYGSTLEMTATPKFGYEFEYWGTPAAGYSSARSMMRSSASNLSSSISESDIEKYSTENPLTMPLNRELNLCAVFKPKKMRVNVTYNAEGGTVSVGSGMYDYGTVLNFEAAANDGYIVTGFVVNDVAQEGSSAEVTVDREVVNVEVNFESTAPKNILLLEDEDYTPGEVASANVKLYRSFRKDAWNTICLPCPVADPVTVFGTGTKVACLDGMNGTVLQFSTVNEMLANIPYIIKVGSLDNSTLESNTTRKSYYDITDTELVVPETSDMVPVDSHDGIDFIGSYSVVQVPSGEGYYYISGGALWYIDAAANVTSGRFRGYFHVDGSNSRSIRYVIDGSATGIEDVASDANGDVYDLSGVKVRKQGDTRRLAPGIYVSEGKKYVVK